MKITNHENQINVDLEVGDTMALLINGISIKEYTVGADNKAHITLAYQEQALSEKPEDE